MGNVVPIGRKKAERRCAETAAFLARHPSIAQQLTLGRGTLERDEKWLRRIERQLERGTYTHGPRKGQPFDEDDRASREGHADYLRECIVKERGRLAYWERHFGFHPEPAA
jgi:hypothetical protein